MDDIQAMTDALPEASDTTAVTPTASPDDAALPPSAGDGDALTVKFNKQTVTLSRDDATRYAQKGMKYDTVEPLLTKLREIAAREGKTLAAWVEGIGARDGSAVSEETALPPGDGFSAEPEAPPPRDTRSRGQDEAPDAASSPGNASDCLAARLAEDYRLLCRTVPEVGGFDTLPPDVLREAAEHGISLLDAYLRHDYRERQRVAAEQAAQSAAAACSIGSQSAGAAAELSSAERAMMRGVWG